MLTMVPPDSSEPALKGATVDKFFQNLYHEGSERAVLGFVGVRVTFQEGGLVSLGALPRGEIRGLRVRYMRMSAGDTGGRGVL